MSILVIAEHNNQTLKAATLNTITAARALGDATIDVLVAGHACQAVADQAAQIAGVHKVLLADAEVYQHQLAENLAQLVQSIAQDKKFILAPATTFGKDCMPRIAGLLDIVQISAVTQIIDANTFVRPIYAGNAFATVSCQAPLIAMTIQGTAFAAAAQADSAAAIETLSTLVTAGKTQFVSQALSQSDRPELTSARVVVSGGRALQSKENFALIDELADKLGAAVGASRAAVDAGYVPNDCQVGQTGKVVAPELYIAIGISGAIQHLAGMSDSKVIVAINKDAEAPIFEIADYGLVGDLFTLVPELIAALA